MAICRTRACAANYFKLLAIIPFLNMLYSVFDTLHATTCIANAGSRRTEAVVHAVKM
jgi:hypothetical protein